MIFVAVFVVVSGDMSSVTTGGVAEIYVMKKLYKERLRKMEADQKKKMNTADGEVSQRRDLEHRQGEEGEGETVSATCCFPLLQHKVHPKHK